MGQLGPDIICDHHLIEERIVETYKYLGVIIDNKLNWQPNTEAVIKKVQSRMHCLRKLRSFEIDQKILQIFYSSSVLSVLTFGAVCWGGNVAERERGAIDKTIKKAGDVIGKTQENFDSFYRRRLTDKTNRILTDDSHPMRADFDKRRSVRSGRMKQVDMKTERYRRSFFPRALNAINDAHVR